MKQNPPTSVIFSAVGGFFLVFFTLFVTLSAPPAFGQHPKRYKVCSITINSSEEIETFREYLPEEYFEFIELVPKTDNPPPPAEKEAWFNSACESGVRCDIIVSSGHFAGEFTGESGYSLSLRTMERMACSQKCRGILSQAKEVFLFGCNTLASKQADFRTPEEYLQDLLDHGYSRSAAESAVTTRYSSFDITFDQRMRFAFAGPERRAFLYGFHSQSPFGKNVKHMLENYFQKIIKRKGGYYEYFSGKDESAFPNLFWDEALKVTNRTQGLSANYDDPVWRTYQEFCPLYDETRGDRDNMLLAADLMKGEGMTLYFVHVADFFRRRKNSFNKEAVRLYEELQNDTETAEKWLAKYEEERDFLESLPFYRFDWLRFLRDIQWISPEFYEKEMNHILRQLVLQRDIPDRYLALYRLGGVIGPEPFQHTGIVLEDLPKGYFNQPQNLKSLGLLRPSDSRIHWRIVNALKTGDSNLKIAALKALGIIRPSDPAIHREIAGALKDRDPAVRKEALLVLGGFSSLEPIIHQEIASLLNENEEIVVIKEALWALGMIRPSDPAIHWKITGFLEHENVSVLQSALSALGKIRPSDPAIHWKVAGLLGHEDVNILREALLALGMIRPSDSAIHWKVAGLLGHEDVNILREALLALGMIRPSDPAIHWEIAKGLGHEDTFVWQGAIRVLGKVHPSDPVIHIAVAQSLQAEDPGIQNEAFTALMEIRPSNPAAHLKIISALGHERDFVRQAAFRLLNELKPQNMAPYTREICIAVDLFYTYERQENRVIDLAGMGVSCP